MKILNFGSLNIDHVYHLDEFVRPGETIACSSYTRFCGGKGLNQSIALAHGGGNVFHGGQLGADSEFLKCYLADHGVQTDYVRSVDSPTGHAIIQVNRAGENAIVIYGGANREISTHLIADALQEFREGDWLLVQNEISGVAEIMQKAKRQGMQIAFNPAPFTTEVHTYPLEQVDLFVLNETEAQGITGETERSAIIKQMQRRYPQAAVVYTLGTQGAIYTKDTCHYSVVPPAVKAIDTTGAGDTFIGFFLSSLTLGRSIEQSLARAVAAAAICVTRPGAADSIPDLSEVEKFQLEISR